MLVERSGATAFFTSREAMLKALLAAKEAPLLAGKTKLKLKVTGASRWQLVARRKVCVCSVGISTAEPIKDDSASQDGPSWRGVPFSVALLPTVGVALATAIR